MTNEQDNPGGTPSPTDRLEQIKKEEQEDASSYYAQGKSEDDNMTEEDFNKPVPPVDEEKEELNMMKALAYLGFGMGALAIIVILFYVRNLDHKVGDVNAAVGTLEEKFGPLKMEMEEKLTQVNTDMGQLKERFGKYEKQAAVTELKRALVAIQTVTENTSPEVQAKSGQVVASIENLLHELRAGTPGAAPAPAAVAPAPAAIAPAAAEEKPFEIILEQTGGDTAPAPAPEAEHAPAAEAQPSAEAAPEHTAAAEAPTEAAPAAEEPKAEAAEPAAEEAGGGAEEADDEEDEEDEDE